MNAKDRKLLKKLRKKHADVVNNKALNKLCNMKDPADRIYRVVKRKIKKATSKEALEIFLGKLNLIPR